MPLRLAVASLAVALLLPAAARAGQPPAADLDAPAYVAMLQHLADQVRATDGPAAAATLAHDLPPTWTVRAGDQRFTVPAAPIVDALTCHVDSGVVVARVSCRRHREDRRPARGGVAAGPRRCAAAAAPARRAGRGAGGAGVPRPAALRRPDGVRRSRQALAAQLAAGCRDRAPRSWCRSSATRPG